MQTLVLALIATDFLLIIALIIAMATIRKIRRSSSEGEGEKLMALESKLRIYFENMERDDNEFRKEVASYLEKNMESSLSVTRSIYSQSESQSKSLNASLSAMNERLSSSLMDLKLASKGEMEAFSKSLQGEFEKIRAENEKSITNISEQTKTLVSLVRADMEKIRSDNEKKLEEMRKTVDEKLQSTLETRLTESFKLVSNNLDQLRSALGEINKLSRDVSDLNKIFGNVKSRGVWGEVQVEAILSDILSPEQYVRNFHPKAKGSEVVEFAVRLPGKDDGQVYIPIDSKFPKEDYERYVDAVTNEDEEAVRLSLKALRERVRKEAQDISEKYINPPRTTDFAILFVPTESLYAELLRDPGYVDGIQNRYKVIISGPTTFSALLISLGMGFRTLQIEKKTKEVRDLFAKIKSLMAKFSEELVQTQNAIGTAGRRIESVIKRNGMIAQKLQNIELSDDGSNSIDIPLIEENSSETE